jgi:hypothetical protein
MYQDFFDGTGKCRVRELCKQQEAHAKLASGEWLWNASQP